MKWFDPQGVDVDAFPDRAFRVDVRHVKVCDDPNHDNEHTGCGNPRCWKHREWKRG